MKNFSIYIATLFLFCCLQSRADHFAGGEFHWTKLGADSYYVTLTLYLGCNGTGSSSSSFTITDSLGNSITYNPTLISSKDVTPVCPGSCTKCSNSTCTLGYGIQAYTFGTKVYLAKFKTRKCTYTLSWDQCCRFSDITTGGSGNAMYIEAKLNTCYGTDNSPAFTSPPLLIVPKDKCISYNIGAWDDDRDSLGRGDSLVYMFVKPRQYATSFTDWASPYTWDKPLKFDSFPKKDARWNPPSCSGFHLDPHTGDLNFEAKKVETTVLTISVSEYRKDKSGKAVKTGEITRDLVLIVTQTPRNNLPALSGLNGRSTVDTFICAGQPFCFTINSADADTADSLEVGWNNVLPKATFTATSAKQPTATFCWTPSDSNIRTTPYQLVFNVKDNKCPLYGFSTKAIRLHVIPAPKDKFLITDQGCGNVQFAAKSIYPNNIKNYLWQGDDSLYSKDSITLHHYKKAGRYKYQLTVFNNSGCSRTDTGSVTVSPYLSARLQNDTSVCQYTTLTLNPNTKNGILPLRYIWSNGDTTPAISAQIVSDSVFYVHVKDKAGCEASDTIHVRSHQLPTTPAITLTGLDTLVASVTNAADYIWYRNSFLLGNNTRKIHALPSGKYQVAVLDSNGCVSPLSNPYFFTNSTESKGQTADIAIYPNPTDGKLEIDAPAIMNARISILNMTGQVLSENAFSGHIKIDLSTFSKGIYLLKLHGEQGLFTKKIVIK